MFLQPSKKLILKDDNVLKIIYIHLLSDTSFNIFYQIHYYLIIATNYLYLDFNNFYVFVDDISLRFKL